MYLWLLFSLKKCSKFVVKIVAMFLKNLFRSSTNSDKITVLSATEFQAAIQKKGVQLIDVRTPNEYAAGNIKGAKNLNLFDSSSFQKGAAALDKALPIYLYCQSGNRSKSASSLFVKMGFSQVFDLKGGYTSWPF